MIHRLFASVAMAGAGILTIAGSALADIPPRPRDVPEGKIERPLTVRYDANKDCSFLYISKDALGGVQDVPAPPANKSSLWSPSPLRSIIAALAMSGAVVAIFLVPRGRWSATAAGCIAGAAVIACAVELYSNAPPPASALREPNDQVRALRENFNGDVVVEIVDRPGVELVVGTKPKPKYQRPRPPSGR
jgi:hypothetical protein